MEFETIVGLGGVERRQKEELNVGSPKSMFIIIIIHRISAS